MFHFSLGGNDGIGDVGELKDALSSRKKKGFPWIKVYVYWVLVLDVDQTTTLGILGLFDPL